MKIQPYILLSILAAFGYGIANPMMRYAQSLGLSVGGSIFYTAIGGMTVWAWHTQTGQETGSTPIKAAACAVAIGVIWTASMLLWTRALKPDMNSTTASVFLIVGLNPLIAATVSTVWFKEWDRVVIWKLGVAGLLIAGALYLINTSAKEVSL
jgi:drug/metabolite transporter (DMT)-like permease